MNNRSAVNHKIRKHFNELIYNVARYTEVVLSIVILIVIALSCLRLPALLSCIWTPIFLQTFLPRHCPL